MKRSLKEALHCAQKEHYAIPAFNCSDCWHVRGVMEAAKSCRSPAIIQVLPQVAKLWSYELLGTIWNYLERYEQEEIYLHLDHAKALEDCRCALEAGFDSVMLDASALPIAENAALCRQVSDLAEKYQALVEGEVGHIRGKNAEAEYWGDDYLASVEHAVYLTQHSGIDLLAVGIGNQHGFYRAEPNLNFHRLQEIHAQVAVPLVLHGGSGITDHDIHRAIAGGICKINIGTQINHVYLQAAQAAILQRGTTSVVNVMERTAHSVFEEAARWMQLCMSANKAVGSR